MAVACATAAVLAPVASGATLTNVHDAGVAGAATYDGSADGPTSLNLSDGSGSVSVDDSQVLEPVLTGDALGDETCLPAAPPDPPAVRTLALDLPTVCGSRWAQATTPCSSATGSRP